MRSGHPGAEQCPVCKAAVCEDHLLPLCGRRRSAASCCNVERRQHDGDGKLWFDVQQVYGVQNQLGQHYGGGAVDHWGWMLHSTAGHVIASAAVAVLPWAFPGGRLPLPPRPVIVCNGRRQRRVEDSLQQLWLFLAMLALLCFLLL
ncbi:uncharacterized protein LOC133920757 [Phragmites australis]|uniref:uncharacterized protein LOC133920757 n=1 Tax=Phragmites australis TaxID=29695 RepID=UPI002D797A43|nr:uncharacterized protein LOC133920757 [Phragmites australis]